MYRISKSTIKTKEEKVAERMGVLLSDFSLDLEKVGYYLAKATPYVIFRRATEVLSSAEFQQPLLDDIRNEGYYNDKFFK